MTRRIVHIVLLESSLELVPFEIAGHSSVIRSAKKRGKKPSEILLDKSLHYHAMKKLREAEKRGRPDIVHVSLLEALESPLNKEGFLRIYVHTYPGDVIFIDPSTRIPRNYNRFVGLMEQLLTIGKVPPDTAKPLMYVKTMRIEDLIENVNTHGLILLRETGERKKPIEVVEYAIKNNYLIGIGGFPHGDFSEKLIKISKAEFSIYDRTLATWIVLSRIIVAAEAYYGLL